VRECELETRTRSQVEDVTALVHEAAARSGVRTGIAFVFVPHTTAGVKINENADPDVKTEFLRGLDKIVPWDDGYAHGEGNSAAHLKASWVGSSVSVPVEDGRLALGTRQGVWFCEFDGPRSRHSG
jgi:secondary thiamine-phosphate synthase enzyme